MFSLCFNTNIVTRRKNSEYVLRSCLDPYSSLSFKGVTVSRRMSLARNIARLGERRGAHSVLVGKPKVKRRLGRPKLEDKVERYFKEVIWEGMDWIDLAQDVNKCRAPMNAVMNLRFP